MDSYRVTIFSPEQNFAFSRSIPGSPNQSQPPQVNKRRKNKGVWNDIIYSPVGGQSDIITQNPNQLLFIAVRPNKHIYEPFVLKATRLGPLSSTLGPAGPLNGHRDI